MAMNQSQEEILYLEPNVTVSVLMTLTSVVIILANIYIVAVLVTAPSLRTPSVYLMGSLAVADFMVGCNINIPMWYSDANGSIWHSWFVCQYPGFLACVCTLTSMYTLALLSLDKYIAITRPLRYNEIVTTPRCVSLIIGTWTFSLGVCIPPLFSNYWSGEFRFEEASRICFFDPITSPYYSLTIVGVVFTPSSIVMGFCYVKILKISLRQSKKVAETMSSVSDGPKITKTNLKAIRTLLIIVLAFYIAWTPFSIELVIRGLNGESLVHDWVLVVTSILAISNSYFNAFIYTFTNKKFRQAAVKLFLAFCVANPNHSSTS